MKTKEVTRGLSGRQFILARQGEMNERQREAILGIVERELLGERILTPFSTEEEILSFIEKAEVEEGAGEQIRRALLEGKNIYAGSVSEEQFRQGFGELLEAVWDALEDNSD